MTIEAGVQKTMNAVMSEINKTQNTNTPPSKKEIIIRNIGKIFSVPVDEIKVNENIRSHFETDSADFLKLVESIDKFGIVQSIVVEFRNKGNDDYELICVAGHRRLEAAKKLGIEKVPCLVHQYSNPSDRTGVALAENLNREGLHSLDIGEGYAELKTLGWEEELIAKHFDRDIKTIQRYLNISRWPDDVKKIVRENPNKFTHTIIMKKFSVRRYGTDEDKEKLRLEVLSIAFGNKTDENIKKQNNDNLENHKLTKIFSERFGLKSDLKESGEKGKFTISFSNKTEKEKLLLLINELSLGS